MTSYETPVIAREASAATGETERQDGISKEVSAGVEEAIGRFPPEDRALLETVVSMVVILHDGQSRKSGEAYSNHVLRVAARIVNQFGVINKDLFIAGLFHDAVEDQLERLAPSGERDEAFAALADTFSLTVSRTVQGVTNPVELDYLTDRHQKNQAYIEHVIPMLDNSDDCFIVKLADFFDNAMQLQQNESLEVRLQGTRKYEPLFDYFLERLATFGGIEERRRLELMMQIKEQQVYVKALLAL